MIREVNQVDLFTFFDIANTREILGYQPTYSFKDLLSDLAEYGPKGPPLPELQI